MATAKKDTPKRTSTPPPSAPAIIQPNTVIPPMGASISGAGGLSVTSGDSALKDLAKDSLLMALTMFMDFYAAKLAAKDVNTTGADDAIAIELHGFANKIRLFQITGFWPETTV